MLTVAAGPVFSPCYGCFILLSRQSSIYLCDGSAGVVATEFRDTLLYCTLQMPLIVSSDRYESFTLVHTAQRRSGACIALRTGRKPLTFDNLK